MPNATPTGETNFALSELARQAGSGRLVWRDLVVNHARLHTDLEVWIYRSQTLADLARPSLMAACVVLVVGLLIAIPKDVQWLRSRRHGRRLKGPELVSIRQFNRRTRADGVSFIQTQRLTAKLLGVQRALAIAWWPFRAGAGGSALGVAAGAWQRGQRTWSIKCSPTSKSSVGAQSAAPAAVP